MNGATAAPLIGESVSVLAHFYFGEMKMQFASERGRFEGFTREPIVNHAASLCLKAGRWKEEIALEDEVEGLTSVPFCSIIPKLSADLATLV